MKYFAAVGNKNEIDAVCVFPPFNILCSYHYFKKKKELILECLQKQIDVFIDSGAFSARSKGISIDLDEYCKWLIETGVTTYAGLDVIGDAAATKKNIKYMEKEYGLNPIPAFHLGSSLDSLAELCDNYPYIAFGGLVWSEGVKSHLDKSWNYVLKHAPKLRVHGFGMTNVELMKEYPWYSVDSSSFKWCMRFGDQYILWNGLELQGIREEQYLDILEKSGYVGAKNYEKAHKYHIYMLHSIQAYKTFAAHLTELNKVRKFEHLTAVQTLF